MASLHLEDDIDEDFLVEIPCEFCSISFPLYLLIEHQSACRPDLARLEPTVEEIEAEILHASSIDQKQKNKIDNEGDSSVKKSKENIKYVENEPLKPKSVQMEKSLYNTKEDSNKENETATLAFGSSSNPDKKVEEEKPTYKIPLIPILGENDKRRLIQNDLHSDNEEGESLEDFWKRAEVKLELRMRALSKKDGC